VVRVGSPGQQDQSAGAVFSSSFFFPFSSLFSHLSSSSVLFCGEIEVPDKWVDKAVEAACQNESREALCVLATGSIHRGKPLTAFVKNSDTSSKGCKETIQHIILSTVK
jgi:hypothetical protein